MSDSFVSKEGEEAVHALDGEWLQPESNPFLHGCCDCGLAHQVDYRVVNADTGLAIANNRIAIQLRFTTDVENTKALREHRRKAERSTYDDVFLGLEDV